MKNNKKKLLIMISLSLFSLTIVSIGAYAVWNLGEGLFTTENTITSGQVTMSYSETNQITLENALPMNDNDGRKLTNYFDFTVSTYIKTNLEDDKIRTSYYDILIEKLSPTTNTTELLDSEIKVYLTKIVNDEEIVVVAPTTIDKLNDYLLLNKSEEFKLGKGKIETNYRLRVWLDFDVDANKFDGTTNYSYNFRVNINGETSGSEYEVLDASLNPRGIVPEGAVYYSGVTNINTETFEITAEKTYLPGDSFPEVQTGDIYFSGDYGYSYNFGTGMQPDLTMNGWQVALLDTTKSEYGAILESINGKEIVSLLGTFSGCTNLITAPAIPSGVTDMSQTFDGCTALENAPTIPSGVTDMDYTFYGCTSLVNAPDMSNAISVTSMFYTFENCTSLVNAPVIPSSVIYMVSTFENCTSLTGNVEVNADSSYCQETFKSTTKPIKITGSCSLATKEALVRTSDNGNVSY